MQKLEVLYSKIQKIMFSVSQTSEVLVQITLENKIRASDMSEHEQDQFMNMLSYLTASEQEELRGLL